MKNKEIGWATFYNEAVDFSEQFQIQMSEQLEVQFKLMLGIPEKSFENEFMIFVGMMEMKTTVNNDHSFALVEIICPNSFSKLVTAYWRSDKYQDLLKITQTPSISKNDIEFGWCSDFDKDYFLKFFASKNKLNSEKNDISFDVEFDFIVYPDVSIKIVVSEPLKDSEITNIHEMFLQNLSSAYVSELSELENDYSLIIDFQNQPLEDGTKELLNIIQQISKSENGRKIRKMIIN